MRSQKSFPRRTRGAALFFSLLTSLLMLTFVLPFLFKLSSRNHITEKSFRDVAAMNLAEAGVERAIWELNHGDISAWSGDVLNRTLTMSSVTTSGGTVAGDITISVANPASDNPVVTSKGTVAWQDGLNIERTLRVTLKHGFESFFNFGIFGDEGFDLHGNAYTDSYNSDIAPYDPFHPGSLGDVGTNASHHWDVVLLNNTVINGNATTGYQSDPADVIRLRNQARIMGAMKTLDTPKLLPPVQPPTLTNRGAFTTSGSPSPVTISASGTYSSFTIATNTKVTVTGDVTLYVNGPLLMDSNSTLEIATGSHVEIVLGNGAFTQRSNTQINNLTQDPKALAFVGTSDFTTMTWRSNSQFWGVLYAPNATIDYCANSDFFGSVVCNSISMSSNAGIHYDESLGTWEKYGTQTSAYVVKSWQEKSY
jgi:Tfp pilus assembly protein PilX